MGLAQGVDKAETNSMLTLAISRPMHAIAGTWGHDGDRRRAALGAIRKCLRSLGTGARRL
ncbi:hypothetical protein THIOKS1860007 [Thiocapsa sp. KS1]|nr:hypothetical protein THIOKS1860007 [Thiocapsa sp. KS1]